jgi:hypothetical protein
MAHSQGDCVNLGVEYDSGSEDTKDDSDGMLLGTETGRPRTVMC